MKLTFIALALEDIKLSKLHRSGRVISRINNCIQDDNLQINADMTGDELLKWYNQLDEENQILIDELSLFLPEEEQFIIKDIHNVRVQHESGYETERNMYKMLVAFVATTMVIITLVTNTLYYMLSKQEKLVAHSNILEVFISIYRHVREHVSTEGTSTIIEPSIDKSDGIEHTTDSTEVKPTKPYLAE